MLERRHRGAGRCRLGLLEVSQMPRGVALAAPYEGQVRAEGAPHATDPVAGDATALGVELPPPAEERRPGQIGPKMAPSACRLAVLRRQERLLPERDAPVGVLRRGGHVLPPVADGAAEA